MGEKKANGQSRCAAGETPGGWFDHMIDHCYDYAVEARHGGRPIIGVLCEYTPRELILAAGGVPVCLCGGSAEMIPPAEEDLPANLCPLIKSTYGYHKRRANPFLEMAALIVAETTCDGKKKMYELMGLTRPMCVLELPQMPDGPDALEHWRRQLGRFQAELEGRLKVTITHEKLRRAIADMNRERASRRKLAELMRCDRPPMTGRQLLTMKSSISCMPGLQEQFDRAVADFSAAGGRDELAGRVRVLMTGVPMVLGAERVLDIVEDSGGLVVCLESCTGLKPILDDVDESAPDPLRALAEKYLHLPCSVMTANTRRLDVLRRLVAEYRPQCVIELIWQACLTYDVESHLVRRLVQDELHLPYLAIRTDYSPADSSRIALRVEALFETARGRGQQ